MKELLSMALQLRDSDLLTGSLRSTYFAYFVVALLAAAMGIIAASGNFLLLLVIAGFVGGIILLSSPVLLWTLLIIGGFVISGTVRYFLGYQGIDWLVDAAGAALWLLVIITMADVDRQWLRGVNAPPFIFYLWVFFFIGVLATLMSGNAAVQLAVGIKNYMLLFGATVALYIMPWPRKIIFNFIKLMVGIGLIQWVVTFYQYFLFRSHRLVTGGLNMGGTGDSLVEASDSIVGTFGGDMFGGGLGTSLLPTYIAIQLAIVLSFYYKKKLSNYQALLFFVLLTIPVLMAEAKSIFVYFPLVILLLTWSYYRSRPLALIGAGIGVIFLIIGGLVAYQALHWSAGGGSLRENTEKYFSYSFAEKARPRREHMGGMTRLESLLYWQEQHGLNNLKELLIGDGLSASKSSSRVYSSQLVVKNNFKELDKTSLSGLLWDSGIIGTMLFLGSLISAYLVAGKVTKSPVLTADEQAIVSGLRVGVVILIASLPYTKSVMQTAPGALMFFLVLGLIAYYYRISRTEKIAPDLIKNL